ncbi:MAG: DNA integrity scanning diadenylate cyclase DisA [Acidimicrobiia bacterium]|nr:DNA integrity scanning diadenylate cyclase DisA [Acidimicrobiia bacterium]
MGGQSIQEMLERLAPGTPIRRALERIIQQGKGGLIVMGDGPEVTEASSGGFYLRASAFTPARLAELSKMDGGIVLDESWNRIVSANVHFVPDGSIGTDETGARHRTAERMAVQTGKAVIAVSEGRHVATLFYKGQKVELASPTEVAAHVNQELQSLDRLRRRLDEAEARLTQLEVSGVATYRTVLTVLQRAELVLRLGDVVAARASTMGDESRIVALQLNDMLAGVEQTLRFVLQDYIKPLRAGSVNRAYEKLTTLGGGELEDQAKLGRELGFPDVDDHAEPRGHRILSQAGRLPDSVRNDLVRHFGRLGKIFGAAREDLIAVEGVGETRADQLRSYFDRLESMADELEPLTG